MNYKSVIIGSQEWMAENLNSDIFRTGDIIPEARSDEEWTRAGKEKMAVWCYYKNDPKNGLKYGRLYNFYAVKDSRALAPEGWHMPNYDEFKDLKRNSGLFEDEAFNMLVAGGSSGFNSLFGGWRDEEGGFHDLEVNAGYHCDANSDMNALNIRGDWKKAFIYGFPFSATGFSVRCLKD